MKKKKRQTRKKASNRKAIYAFAVTAVLAVGVGCFFTFRGKTDAPTQVDLDELLSNARSQYETGQFEETMRLLDEQMMHLAEHADALELYGLARLRVTVDGNAHIQAACQYLQRASKLDKSNTSATIALRNVYKTTNDKKMWIRMAEQANLRDPSIANSKALVEALEFDGKDSDVIGVANDILQSNPSELWACEASIRAMVRQGKDELSLLEFIEQCIDKSQDTITRDQLLLVLSGERGDTETYEAVKSNIVSSELTPKQASWVATELQATGDVESATKLISSVPVKDLEKPLARRQAFQFILDGKLSEAASLAKSSQFEANEEMIARAAFAFIELNEDKEASLQIQKLEEFDSRLAKTWQGMLSIAIDEDATAKAVLEQAMLACQTYPQSVFLRLYEARGYRAIGETDLAIKKYRDLIRAASRWVLPRVELSTVLVDQQKFEPAFIEATNALRIDPKQDVAFASMLMSAINLTKSKSELLRGNQNTLAKTVGELALAARDDKSALLLKAVVALLNGDTRQPDSLIEEISQSSEILTSNELQMLAKMATAPRTRRLFETKIEQQMGSPIPEIVALAVEASAGDSAKGSQFIDQFKAGGTPLDDLTKQIAKAGMLSILKAPIASDAWLQIAEDNPNAVRITKLVLQQPAIESRYDDRRKLIQRLREATGDSSIDWQLAETELTLDESPTARTAAQVVLRLTDLRERSTTSEKIYVLLDEAYTLLQQPQSALQVMSMAIEAGVRSPTIYLRATVLAHETKQSALAIQHAKTLLSLPTANNDLQSTAVRILLEEQDYRAAEEFLRKGLPNPIPDTDIAFQQIGIYAIAAVQAGKIESVRKMLQPLAHKSDRWFSLWVDAASIETLPKEDSVSWLTDAEAWISDNELSKKTDLSRSRKLALGWQSIAARSNNVEAWQKAFDLFAPTLRNSTADKDKMTLARMAFSAELTEKAIALYVELSESENALFSTVASNNLANLLLDEGKLKEAEAAARNSMKRMRKAASIDTLAAVLIESNKDKEAIQLLTDATLEFPTDLGTRIRLAQLYVAREDLKNADRIILQLDQIRRDTPELSIKRWKQIESLKEQITRRRTLEAS